ncbi:hypothetical protein ACH5RR_033352 [Cinchona calisaya]|uniref:Uncharacterized protein n=1 Tax=Cinchona calisaya TaxID=153742 RepID=A0ABD2YPS0_9GENT
MSFTVFTSKTGSNWCNDCPIYIFPDILKKASIDMLKFGEMFSFITFLFRSQSPLVVNDANSFQSSNCNQWNQQRLLRVIFAPCICKLRLVDPFGHCYLTNLLLEVVCIISS